MDRLSRRQLIGVVAGSSAALAIAANAVLAQTPPAAPDFDKAARDSHRENSAILAGFEIPMSLEPAFQFKA
jgi:hypothetical protein